MNLYNLIVEILSEISENENNVSIAGGRGYSAGKVYSDKTVSVLRNLGIKTKDEEEEYEIKPVKISKAFKRRKN